ncbi:hypothetical protein GCM10020331_048950 [Ectobacillus funiculus]
MRSILLDTNYEGLSEETLSRVKKKKKKIGGVLRSLNSPEFIANQFTRYAFNGSSLFDALPILEEITIDDLKAAAQEFINEKRMSICQVVPKR